MTIPRGALHQPDAVLVRDSGVDRVGTGVVVADLQGHELQDCALGIEMNNALNEFQVCKTGQTDRIRRRILGLINHNNDEAE